MSLVARALTAATVLMASSAGDSSASSWAPPGSDYVRTSWPSLSPPDGATEVPTNTVVMVQPDWVEADLWLETSAGPVELARTGRQISHKWDSEDGLVEFGPISALDELVLHCITVLEPETEPVELGCFTTGAGSSGQTLSPPELGDYALSWPRGATSPTGTFEVRSATPWVFAAAEPGELWSDWLAPGEEILDAGLRSTELQLHDPVEMVSFVGMDFAGQTTGWSESEALDWPAQGCSVSDRMPSGLGLLALFCMAALSAFMRCISPSSTDELSENDWVRPRRFPAGRGAVLRPAK